MTMQIRDTIYYNDNSYSIVGTKGKNDSAIFDPEVVGLEPEMFITACDRGYHCGFYIWNNQLILANLVIKDKNGEYPQILDAQPKPSSFGTRTYQDINLAIEFNGSLIIARDSVESMMGTVPEAFNIVLELYFDEGKLTKCQDISRLMWKKRMRSPYFKPSNISEWSWVILFAILSTFNSICARTYRLVVKEDYTKDIPALLETFINLYACIYEKYIKEHDFLKSEIVYFSVAQTYLCYLIVKENSGRQNKKALSQFLEYYQSEVYAEWERLCQQEIEEKGYNSLYYQIPKEHWKLQLGDRLFIYGKSYYQSEQFQDVFEQFHTYGLSHTTADRKQSMAKILFPFLEEASFAVMMHLHKELSP